ncbi:MAG: bifunctional precorrin-2 dehydrogenase/sirohydrochlorin ferrochelatase [Bacteroidota bacterium]
MNSLENTLFPIFLKLDKIKTLIVGGGFVGLEKLEALLKNDTEANVRLIAPEIRDEIWELADEHTGVRLIQKRFDPTDLRDIDLAILATADRATNHAIRKQAKKKGIITNVADTPDLCDFYLGSTVKKGNLKIGISTNGQSPTFAKRFREVLENILPEDTNELLGNLKKVRDQLKGDFSHKVSELNRITKTLVDKT